MKEIVTVRFLGQCLPRNPGGIACYAYIIRNKEGLLLHESCGLAAEPNSPSSTNSVANYIALIKALEWLIKNRYTKDIIKVYGNSKLVISQINDGEAFITNNKDAISKNVLPLYTRVTKMKSKFYYISFELNRDYDNNRHMDDKEVEELSLLAYIEGKTKILKQSGSVLNNSASKNIQELKQKLFSSAAELMMATGNN
ncbi:MAG: reverse transcriptase-like protein [Thermoproteota archaeon]|jgi:ribonuclease HI|nr:reverse transcriptase-like protein [Thermoproteota archaeon]